MRVQGRRRKETAVLALPCWLHISFHVQTLTHPSRIQYKNIYLSLVLVLEAEYKELTFAAFTHLPTKNQLHLTLLNDWWHTLPMI